MITQQEFTKQVAAFGHRSVAVAVALVAGIAACADGTTRARITEPTTPSFGKNVTGSNQKMLFSSFRDGNQEVYSMNADGTGLIRLTYSPGHDDYAVWSPDGKRIAFTSTRDNPYGDIYTMNADGSGVVRLTSSAGTSQQPSWSKDGKQITFVSNRHAADPAAYSLDEIEIYVMNADGTGVTRITNNTFKELGPVWSPDGKQIAFTSNRDGQGTGADLYLMNIDGTQVKRLTTNGSSTYPSWEPHGRSITYTSGDSFAPGIYVIDPTTLAFTRLTFGGVGIDGLSSFSNDGTKIAFGSIRDGNYEIYSMNADGSQQTRLTNDYAIDWFVRWGR